MIRAFLLSLVFVFSLAGTAVAQEKADEVPYRQDAGLITAEYYLSTGKYTQAVQVLNGVMERHPQSADAHVYRGFAYAKLGEEAKAKTDYNAALAIDPRHLGANFYIAQMYVEAGEKAQAFEQLQVLRLICGAAECAELTELESLINAAKKPAKSE